MKVIDEEKFGQLICCEDENGEGLCWARKEKISLFNKKEEELLVKFDFFLHNKNFIIRDRDKEYWKTMKIKIEKAHIFFVQQSKLIEEALLNFCNEEIIDENLERNSIDNIAELNKIVNLKEIWIFQDGYGVLVKTPIYETSLVIQNRNILEEEAVENIDYIEILPEWEVEAPRLNYSFKE